MLCNVSDITGAFDQHGCPLVVFPADGHDKLATELRKAEVVDFINYFLILHKYVPDKDVSVCGQREGRGWGRDSNIFIPMSVHG